MNKHHEVALLDAKEWLANVDADEFLNEFLELQEHSCGPSIDEFMQILHIPTYALFGLANEDYWENPYTDVTSLNLSEHEMQRILELFDSTRVCKIQRCANDEVYGFKNSTLYNSSDSFMSDSIDEDYSLVA
ncbi:hypothetical protein [Acinetobacter junii]|uniref:hypothetical protein n=1 Tax=Acinetobacter junii TaxID=40215 RepID=UPI0032121B7C